MLNQRTVNIKNKETGRITKLPLWLANQIMAEESTKGMFCFVSKGTAKKVAKRTAKAQRIGAMISMKTNAGVKYAEEEVGNNIYYREFIKNSFFGPVYSGRILVQTNQN